VISYRVSRTDDSDRTPHSDRTATCGEDHDLSTVEAVERQAKPPYRVVTDALRERVQGGEWLPGEQLPTLRDLAEAYGVSVSTVRRALGILKDEGLITVTPGWGIFRAPT
jgi:GntR family transcriptional regulator